MEDGESWLGMVIGLIFAGAMVLIVALFPSFIEKLFIWSLGLILTAVLLVMCAIAVYLAWDLPKDYLASFWDFIGFILFYSPAFWIAIIIDWYCYRLVVPGLRETSFWSVPISVTILLYVSAIVVYFISRIQYRKVGYQL